MYKVDTNSLLLIKEKYNLMDKHGIIKPNNCVGRINKDGYLLRSLHKDDNSIYIPTYETLFKMKINGVFKEVEEE